jgi:transposase
MIVIGVDTHKRSHTLVALDAATGATRGQLTIPASDEGMLDALRFAGELDVERVWAVEDCRHVSGRLERGLVASGDRVIRVAPGLTETSRRAVREPGKSDPIDATAIARAALPPPSGEAGALIRLPLLRTSELTVSTMTSCWSSEGKSRLRSERPLVAFQTRSLARRRSTVGDSCSTVIRGRSGRARAPVVQRLSRLSVDGEIGSQEAATAGRAAGRGRCARRRCGRLAGA